MTDTLGPEKQVAIQRLFYMHSNLSGPTKAICFREVFAVRGVCYKRFHYIPL